MLATIRELYEGRSERANRFRQELLVFDLATLAFIVVTSFTPRSSVVEALDILLGVVILAEFVARIAASRERGRELLRLSTWTDVLAIISFLAPLTSEGAGFLRVLRTLRILRVYTTMNQVIRPASLIDLSP
jgi:voltage-gated potassium channel